MNWDGYKIASDFCRQEVTVGMHIVTRFHNGPAVVAPPMSEPSSRWLQVAAYSHDTKQIEIGGYRRGTYRTPGTLMMTLMTVPAQENSKAGDWADEIANVFFGATFNDVRFEIPRVTPVGIDSGWFATSIVCPFRSDKFSSKRK